MEAWIFYPTVASNCGVFYHWDVRIWQRAPLVRRIVQMMRNMLPKH